VERGERRGSVERPSDGRHFGDADGHWAAGIGSALPFWRVDGSGACVGALGIGGAVRVASSCVFWLGVGGAAEL